MNTLGQEGEKIAMNFLEHKGYKIIDKNYRSKFGEIDIIATEGEYIIFIEVKARSAESLLIAPIEAVTRSKQRKIIKTAESYLMLRPTERQPRLDVVCIIYDKGEYTVEHFESAYEAV